MSDFLNDLANIKAQMKKENVQISQTKNKSLNNLNEKENKQKRLQKEFLEFIK